MIKIVFGLALILLVSGCTGTSIDSSTSDYRAGFDDGERSASNELKLQAREIRSCNAELERKTEVTREALELQAKTLSDVRDLTEQQSGLTDSISSLEDLLAEFVENNEFSEVVSDLNSSLNASFESLEESNEELVDELMGLQDDLDELTVSVDDGFGDLEQQISDLNACTA